MVIFVTPKKTSYNMKTITLKTNIMCGACIEKVTPALNEAVGAGNWQVDTGTPDKKLMVHTDANITGNEVIAAVNKAGYKAEAVS